ncbi:uncharacterized protein LOC113227406 [Hyposmocoma kahamanoa]|uniref:uncharacterized protein LOC113227406 n=1 Tax=Hyposmocoma kahamanoa TaxID=1477025 RepID=UPI000E6DA140|nr:uncharacterized protein LOC113227406 [Hyposmocoma kahamanoa]
MRSSLLCLTLLAVAAVVANGEDTLPSAQPCRAASCSIPECQCSSTSNSLGLAPKDTPQFVTLTFDDAVTINNIETYKKLIYDRKNANGCPIGTTFFVSHEYTNYQLVNDLYNHGFEIALHSITHRSNQTYWARASYEDIAKEIGEQKEQLSYFSNIPISEIKGVRAPFLQTSGNPFYQVIKDYDLLYDSSRPTVTYRNPGLWPYTLDYASTQDCPIGPCPTASIPGVWVTPLISWADLEGFPCSFVDACVFTPNHDDEDAWYEFILENFERQYDGTRAPFGFYIHEWYLSIHPAVLRALNRFIDTITKLDDVFMVNEKEVIEWTKNPVNVEEYRTKNCKTISPSPCSSPHVCTLTAEHNGVEYWMSVCTACPLVYPWLGNSLGK